MISEEKKRFRDRANRNRLALLKEKEQHGYINDGSGKRYRAGVFFVLVGENRKALEFFSWFESEFPDDIGEPVFNLYWTLAEYRNGSEDQARYRLQHAMLSNLYMLPFLFGEPLGLLDIWHSSNQGIPGTPYLISHERSFLAESGCISLHQRPALFLLLQYRDLFQQRRHYRLELAFEQRPRCRGPGQDRCR